MKLNWTAAWGWNEKLFSSSEFVFREAPGSSVWAGGLHVRNRRGRVVELPEHCGTLQPWEQHLDTDSPHERGSQGGCCCCPRRWAPWIPKLRTAFRRKLCSAEYRNCHIPMLTSPTVDRQTFRCRWLRWLPRPSLCGDVRPHPQRLEDAGQHDLVSQQCRCRHAGRDHLRRGRLRRKRVP